MNKDDWPISFPTNQRNDSSTTELDVDCIKNYFNSEYYKFEDSQIWIFPKLESVEMKSLKINIENYGIIDFLG